MLSAIRDPSLASGPRAMNMAHMGLPDCVMNVAHMGLTDCVMSWASLDCAVADGGHDRDRLRDRAQVERASRQAPPDHGGPPGGPLVG